jgi:hypothetical protein
VCPLTLNLLFLLIKGIRNQRNALFYIFSSCGSYFELELPYQQLLESAKVYQLMKNGNKQKLNFADLQEWTDRSPF